MDIEVIRNPSDNEPVSTAEVLKQLKDHVYEIRDALIKRAAEKRYGDSAVNDCLAYLMEKSELLEQGLLPSEDHSFLSSIIDTWFNMALTSTQYANEFEQSGRVIRAAVDGVHVVMVNNGLIDPQVQSRILEKWPIDESPSSEISAT